MIDLLDELLSHKNIAYAIFNSNLKLIQNSKNLCDLLFIDELKLNESIYDIFPEYFGLEKEVSEVFVGKKNRLFIDKVNKYNNDGEINYFHYDLIKLNKSDKLLLIISNITDQSSLEQKVKQQQNEIKILKESISELKNNSLQNLLGISEAIKNVKQFAKKIANLNTTNILLTGESGTGKTLVARAIHGLSKNSEEPFVEINCATIPSTLIESEIFGHVKGAFTSAFENKKGLLEEANGGTLFLDEIGELPISVQPKFLTFLETKRFRQIGSTKEINVNVRIISATNKDLKKSILEKEFREDLFYRINVVSLHIPPLRERVEDIVVIANNFIKNFSIEMNKNVFGLTKSAEQKLINYNLPGNIRELKNIIERAVIFCERDIIDSNDLLISESDLKTITKQEVLIPEEGITLDEIEKKYLQSALKKAKGNQTQAAKILGLSLDTFRYRIKKHAI